MTNQNLFCGAFFALCMALMFSTCLRAQTTQPAPADVPAVLNFHMKSLAGDDVDLAKYKGKVILMVNVASKCGNTPQYKPLEAMFEKYKDKGFVILGFPANNFGQQEPGTAEEITEFCRKNYGVTFDMFAKSSVKGDDINPLYKLLTSEDTKPLKSGPVAWNFEKFLIARDGTVAGRFGNKVQPDSAGIVQAVEAELAK